METVNTETTKTELDVLTRSLEKAELYYLDIREKLVEHGRLLDKHRKTAEAATAEATDAGEDWKAALRSSGGDISKSVRELKRQEIAARETAEEFTALVKEVEPDFNDLQAVTCQARSAYVKAHYRVEREKTKNRLNEAAKALFSTDEGKEFLDMFLFQAAVISVAAESDQRLEEMVASGAATQLGITIDDLEKDVVDQRTHKFAYEFMWRMAVENWGETDGNYGFDSPIPLGPYETSSTEASPYKSSHAAARLKKSGTLA